MRVRTISPSPGCCCSACWTWLTVGCWVLAIDGARASTDIVVSRSRGHGAVRSGAFFCSVLPAPCSVMREPNMSPNSRRVKPLNTGLFVIASLLSLGMTTPATLLRQARARAGLSQRALARRAGTAQSVIARIESGQTSPTWETLERLLEAAGVQMRAQIESQVVVGSHMLEDVPRILAMTPEQRLEEVKNLSEFLHHVRRV